jgi:hypothetical protein
VPTCEINNFLLDNQFGQLGLRHDLLTGQQLTLNLSLSSDSASCKLCQLSASYCGQPLGNTSKLRLAYDTSYNLQVVVLGNHSLEPVDQQVATFFLRGPPSAPGLIQATALINNNGSRIWCGNTLVLVIKAFVTIEAPVLRDFLLVANQPILLSDQGVGVSDQTVPCSPTQQELSCAAATRYFYVTHRVTNCLAMYGPPISGDRFHTTTTGGNNATPFDNEEEETRHHYDPFYYYYEAVVQNNTGFLPDNGTLTLCGESYLSLLTRMKLELFCNQDVPIYIRLKPWYTAALYAMTAWWNGRQDESILWLTLATLERACHQRDSCTAEMNDTIFASMMLVLQENDTVNGQETVCSWLPDIATPDLAGVYNVTLPFYATHYGEWYFNLFKYVVPPDQDMPWKSVVLLVLPLLVLVIVATCAALTVHQIFFRPSEHTLNQQDQYAVI